MSKDTYVIEYEYYCMGWKKVHVVRIVRIKSDIKNKWSVRPNIMNQASVVQENPMQGLVRAPAQTPLDGMETYTLGNVGDQESFNSGESGFLFRGPYAH